MKDCIIVKGARKNNLKGIDIEIPKKQLVVFTGVSGSGKSSLLFDTIAAESMRQLNDTFPPYIRNKMPHYSDSEAEKIDQLNTAIVIKQRQFSGNSRSTVATITDIAPLLRLLFSRCAENRLKSSRAYSCFDPEGMCPECMGRGVLSYFDPEKFLDKDKSLRQGAIKIPGFKKEGSMYWTLYANSGFFDPDKPVKDYTDEEMYNLLHGEGPIVKIQSAKGKIWNTYNMAYEGLLDKINHLYLQKPKEALNKTGQKIVDAFAVEATCTECRGTRINKKALNSKWKGYNIYEIGELEISELVSLFDSSSSSAEAAITKEIRDSLQNIIDLGLGYLTLNRSGLSLSGGELQRLKNSRHLRSSLVGMTYIFDEPSAGLHPADIECLKKLFVKLKDRGNSLLIVEHDKQIIEMADYIVDMGPGSGNQGGEVVFQGTYEEFLKCQTATSKYLRQKMTLKENTRTFDSFMEIKDAHCNNLKHLDVKVPYKALTVICGRAGAGKSSLACKELVDNYPNIINISQAPVGTTSRSNIATYIGVMDEIRKVFSEHCNVDTGMFSSNSLGACPVCGGKGYVAADLVFLGDVKIPCESCNGKQYSKEALNYKVKDKNIWDVLRMTVDQAAVFFNDGKILQKLKLLQQVGMGYCTLGQPTDTLSGGECQRAKLTRHIKEKNSLYVIDEPTTGLHGKDIELLMRLLNGMVDKGNTVIIVEHSLDAIKRADWVIEVGPGGGKYGGNLLFQGTPEEMIDRGNTSTAELLRKDI